MKGFERLERIYSWYVFDQMMFAIIRHRYRCSIIIYIIYNKKLYYYFLYNYIHFYYCKSINDLFSLLLYELAKVKVKFILGKVYSYTL